MTLKIIALPIFLLVVSCSKDTVNQADTAESKFISAVDISSFPEIKTSNPIFYDTDGISKDIISILKSKGVNTVRLRLWVNPANAHSGFTEVKQFSEILKKSGLKIWLALH